MPFLFKLFVIVKRRPKTTIESRGGDVSAILDPVDHLEMTDSVGAHPARPFGCVLSLALLSPFGSRGGRIGFRGVLPDICFVRGCDLFCYFLAWLLGSSHARKLFKIIKSQELLNCLTNPARSRLTNKYKLVYIKVKNAFCHLFVNQLEKRFFKPERQKSRFSQM